MTALRVDPFGSDPMSRPAGGQALPADVSGDAELLASVASDLDAVEAALKRLDTDRAGRCDVCRAEITRGDLIADPLRTCCPLHAT